MGTLVIVSVLIVFSTFRVDAATILSVNLISLYNPNNEVYTSNNHNHLCCKNAGDKRQGCNLPCNAVLQVCYRPGNHGPCQQTETSTSIQGQLSIHFTSSISNLSNPVLFHIQHWTIYSGFTVTAFEDHIHTRIIGTFDVFPYMSNADTSISTASVHEKRSLIDTENHASLHVTYKVYHQQLCSPDSATNRVCDSHGNLVCVPHYYGQHCDRKCGPTRNGHCDSNGTLVCDPSYYGRQCERQCIPPPTHGHCDTNGTLRCDQFYYGLHCNKHCIPPPSHGHCDSDGTLGCDQFYYGLLCDKHCIPPPSHGHCDTNGNLQCDKSYYGPLCDKKCITTQLSHGRCENNGTLICDKYYHGSLCDKHCITPLHGQCKANGTLQCNKNYYGLLCDRHCITPPTHGHCDANGTVICDLTYYGLLCDRRCIPPPSHGHCDANGTLLCDPTFSGSKCHQSSSIKNPQSRNFT